MAIDQKARDLQKRISALKGELSDEHMSVIHGLGIYFNGVLPSDVYEPLIAGTARMLNKLYNDFPEDRYRLVLRNAINNTLGIASSMVREMKMGKTRSEDFYRRVKRLGQNLLGLADKVRQSKR